MDDWKMDRIGSALRGENPTVIKKLKSGFAVIADPQFLPGYCVLLAYPKVSCLNDLSIQQRTDFLIDMSLIGDAITKVCKPLRMNYEILGNSDEFLHAHIIPRYQWESEERRKSPIWHYARENWSLEKYQYTEDKFGGLKTDLQTMLEEILSITY